MSDIQAISLTEVYKGWEVYQTHLLQAIRPLTEEQLKLRAAPQLRSMGPRDAQRAVTCSETP